jgi:hypothetical protein
LMLRELQNFSTSEIATFLERKEATVRWRLAEARSMFHDLWVKRRDSTGRGEASIPAAGADSRDQQPEADGRKRRKGQ